MDTNKRNGLVPIIAQAIEEMEVETGFSIPLENINLAELECRTGLSRSKLRTLQAKGFKEQPHGLKGKPKGGILKGYTKHLNVNASRLLEEHQVKYENKTKHIGRRIRLTYMVIEAPMVEVIK